MVKIGGASLEDVSPYFHLPIEEAAKVLGVCSSALKRRCRKLGIKRWPFRKVRSMRLSVARNMEELYCVGASGSYLPDIFHANNMQSSKERNRSRSPPKADNMSQKSAVEEESSAVAVAEVTDTDMEGQLFQDLEDKETAEPPVPSSSYPKKARSVRPCQPLKRLDCLAPRLDFQMEEICLINVPNFYTPAAEKLLFRSEDEVLASRLGAGSDLKGGETVDPFGELVRGSSSVSLCNGSSQGAAALCPGSFNSSMDWSKEERQGIPSNFTDLLLEQSEIESSGGQMCSSIHSTSQQHHEGKSSVCRTLFPCSEPSPRIASNEDHPQGTLSASLVHGILSPNYWISPTPLRSESLLGPLPCSPGMHPWNFDSPKFYKG